MVKGSGASVEFKGNGLDLLNLTIQIVGSVVAEVPEPLRPYVIKKIQDKIPDAVQNDAYLGLGNTVYLLLYALVYTVAMGAPMLLASLIFHMRLHPFGAHERVSVWTAVFSIPLGMAMCVTANFAANSIVNFLYVFGIAPPDYPEMLEPTPVSLLLNLFVIAVLPAILEDFHGAALADRGCARCVVTCTRAPGEEELGKLRAALCRLHHKKDIQFDVRVNPALLGGFTLDIEGVTYDKSVRGALRRLGRQLEERRMA